MKAIILAAGKGTRLKNFSKNKPKGMLEFLGKSILEWQINLFRSCKIKDITIIRGYKSKSINFKGIKFYENYKFDNTNMVESLMTARNEFNDDLIISYSDILFSKKLLLSLINCQKPIAISVDSLWKKYWLERYGNLFEDLENLKISKNRRIEEIGSNITSSKNIKYRYVGLNKFSKSSLKDIVNIYENKKKKSTKWRSSGNIFEKGYMTDLIQELIDNNLDVYASIYKNDWIEIDTENDYKIALELNNKNKLFSLI